MAASLTLVANLGPGADAARAQETAAADPVGAGFYLGAEVGGMNFDNACDPAALSCDHSDTAAAVFAGYRFASRFMVEIGKRDPGEALAVYPRLTSTVDVVGEVEGYDVSALFRLPIGRAWEAYLRGGAYHWDASTSSTEFSTAESDWSPSAGAGFGWSFRPAWQARFQFLYIGDVGGPETGEANVEMLSAGVSYLFGGRRATVASAGAAAAVSEAPPAPQTPPPAQSRPAPVPAAAASPEPTPPLLPVCPPPLPAWDTTVYFGFDSDVPLALASLDELVQRLRERPEAAVRIDGFADPSGPSVYNLNLSRRRAQAVADYFRARGIEASRIEVAWEGETRPVAAASAEESAALSRRVRVTSPSIDGVSNDCRPAAQ